MEQYSANLDISEIIFVSNGWVGQSVDKCSFEISLSSLKTNLQKKKVDPSNWTLYEVSFEHCSFENIFEFQRNVYLMKTSLQIKGQFKNIKGMKEQA